MSYNKTSTTYQQQIELLKARGLTISDEIKAIEFLKSVHYYRLGGYFWFFQKSKKDKFDCGTTFEDIKNLYEFDGELKSLLLPYIQELECSLRSKIAYYHSQNYGANGYLNSANFKNKVKSKKAQSKKVTLYDEVMSKIKDEQSRAKEQYIRHIQSKYNTTDLPIWALIEIISFGTLSKMFKILHPQEKKLILGEYQLGIDPFVFDNWLEQMVIVRNKLAHCARLWDCKLSKGFENPRKSNGFLNQGIDGKRIFFALSVLAGVLQQPSIKKRFEKLLSEYPNIPYQPMGIPNHWKTLKSWSEL